MALLLLWGVNQPGMRAMTSFTIKIGMMDGWMVDGEVGDGNDGEWIRTKHDKAIKHLEVTNLGRKKLIGSEKHIF
jgi:hypothetical protein